MVSQIYPGRLADNMFKTWQTLDNAPKKLKKGYVGWLKTAAEMAGYNLPILPPTKFEAELPSIKVLDESAFYTELDILDEKPLTGYDTVYTYTEYAEPHVDLEDSALLALQEEIESLLDDLEDTPILQDVEPLDVDFNANYTYSDEELDELKAELAGYDYHEYKFVKNVFNGMANDDLDALERTLNAQFNTMLDVDFDYEETEVEYNPKKYDGQYRSSVDTWFNGWCENNNIETRPQPEYESLIEEYAPEEQVRDYNIKELNLNYYKTLDEYMPKEHQTPNEKGNITKYKKGTLKGWYDDVESVDEPLGVYYNKYRSLLPKMISPDEIKAHYVNMAVSATQHAYATA